MLAAAAVHPVAESGFGGVGLAAYEAARPSYPPEAVEHCIDALGLRLPPGDAARWPRVLDLAAGTGKLTRQLQALGLFELAAAEPSEGMLSTLRATCPGIATARAGAAALPFEDGAFDAVFIGQAFHCLGTHQAALDSGWFADLFDVSPSPAACSTLFRWARPITREGAWLRVLSNSFVASLPGAEREGAVRAAVEAWASRHAGRFKAPPGGGEAVADLEMVTEAFVCRRRG